MCNNFYDMVSIKYEGEELKELSVKFTGLSFLNVLSYRRNDIFMLL